MKDGVFMFFLSFLLMFTGCSSKKSNVAKSPIQEIEINNSIEYPADFQEQFIQECTEQEIREKSCQCTLSKIKQEIPFDELKNPDQVSQETMEKIFVFNVECLEPHEVRKSLVIGCQKKPKFASMCPCFIDNVLSRFDKKEWPSILLSVVNNEVEERFHSAMEEAMFMCIEPEGLKEAFVTSCVEGSDEGQCNCLFDQLFERLGEEDFRRYIFAFSTSKEILEEWSTVTHQSMEYCN